MPHSGKGLGVHQCNLAGSLTKPKPDDGIVPTKLFCVNVAVDDENTQRLEELPGREHQFAASDNVKVIDVMLLT
jgi:hypothetical protein